MNHPDREHEETTFPGFVADHADQDPYAVEPEPHPHYDGQRIHIYIMERPRW